jgi:acetylornithine/succinyldiaminopimelate/putrescine aminotransferase
MEQTIVNRLKGALVPDTSTRPERGSATYERVTEVLSEVLDGEHLDTAVTLLVEGLRDAGHTVHDVRAELVEAQADVVLTVVSSGLRDGWITDSQLAKMTSMFESAEISTQEAIDMHEAHKIPVSKLEKDIVPVKGRGAWMMDTKGTWYLDMDSNYSAANLGFSNPEIAQGLLNQASQLITMKEDRVQIPRVRLMKAMLSILPPGLDQFYWQNSGGEAVDKSLKIAKAYTGQSGVIAFHGGFHGRTHGAVSVTSKTDYREPFGLLDQDWVTFLPYGDAEALEARLAEDTEKIVIMELLQGEEGGINIPPAEYIRRVRELTTAHGAVLIADEVQTGFARTATASGQWWAADHFDIVPDIMVIGKSFGGGSPVTAVVTTEEIGSKMIPGFDGSTFGGNPMACVAATIAIRQMKQLDLPSRVAALSKQLTDGLKALDHDLVSEVRGLGMMIGVELPSADHVARLQDELRARGVKSSLSTGPTVRLMPPLVITEQEISDLIVKLGDALDSLVE